MAEMTGGQALVQSLKRNGLDVIFGLPGVQLDWIFDALYDVKDSLPSITPAMSSRPPLWPTATRARPERSALASSFRGRVS